MKIRSLQDWHRAVNVSAGGIIPGESAVFVSRGITGRVNLTTWLDGGTHYRTRIQEFDNASGGTFEESRTYTSARRVRYTRGSGSFITTLLDLQVVEVDVTRNPADGQSASGVPNSTRFEDPIDVVAELDAGIQQFLDHAETSDWAAIYDDNIPSSGNSSRIDKLGATSGVINLAEQLPRIAGNVGSVHPGSYFRLVYDFIERDDGDPLGGPSTEILAADITEQWTGPGDPDDPFGESWHVGGYVRIPPPSIPPPSSGRIAEAANIRTWNYDSDRIGKKPVLQHPYPLP